MVGLSVCDVFRHRMTGLFYESSPRDGTVHSNFASSSCVNDHFRQQ